MRYRTLAAVLLAVVAVVASGACDDDNDNPLSPSPPNNTFTFTSTLLPGNEVPPVTNADASASGTVTVRLDVTRDAAGSITGGSADFTVNLSGFPAGTVLTGAHIHQAPAGQNAGIAVNTGLGNGEVTLGSGSGSFTKENVNVTASLANALVSGPSGFYFNVHTTINPGGAVRGQLALQ
ncbi:MAG TPA: CHRD domain-containing protein [Vicinamibacterales bacterium]|mgnify:CR=1 FL=1|nr:CHRD domain-containing protein [Acidobacteriota bacterium]HOC17259.1 CHRD domain-containing protein [Vicinamibacterales bacterium]